MSHPINAKGDYFDQKSRKSRRVNGENAPAIYSWWVSQGCTGGLLLMGSELSPCRRQLLTCTSEVSLGAWTLSYHTSAIWVAEKSQQNLRASLWSQVSWDAVGDLQLSISLVVKENCSLLAITIHCKRGLLFRFWVGDAYMPHLGILIGPLWPPTCTPASHSWSQPIRLSWKWPSKL